MPARRLKQQSGVVLIVALVFLALIALISTTSMVSSRLEMFMSANEQARLDAVQRAQSIVDALGNQDDSFRVTSLGYLRCNSGHAGSDCDTSANLALANSDVSTLIAGADDLAYSAEFYYEAANVPPASLGSGNASGGAYGAAYFDIQVFYDSASSRGGRTEISQGIGVRIPNSTQGGDSPAGTESDIQMQLPL